MEVTMDETWCGLLSCPHPACWKAQRRVRRGQPRHCSPSGSMAPSPRVSDELPTQKVHNMLDEAFGSQASLADSGFDSAHSASSELGVGASARPNPLLEYLRSKRRRHSSVPTPPQASPSEGTVRPPVGRRLQLLEVQEVFDLTELRPDAWQQHFAARPYYVWIPNPNRRRDQVLSLSSDEDGGNVAPLPTRDVTEEMLPKSVEKENRSADSQKRNAKSSYSARIGRFFRSARQASSGVVALPDRFTVEDKNVLSLLDLPPTILSEVLDQIEKGELITREKLDDLVRQAAATQLQRPESRPHLVSATDLLQQRRAKLHLDSRERNVRQPELHQSRQVFQLDDDLNAYDDTPVPPLAGLSRSRPLPPIAAGDRADLSSVRSPSVQCISVDPPAPAPTAAHSRGASSRTRPFTYMRDAQLDLMLAPISSPPSTHRAETPRTDNDTASMHVAASTDRSTLANEVLPVPHYQVLNQRQSPCSTAVSLVQTVGPRHEYSPSSGSDSLPAGAIPPATTPKTLVTNATKEEIGALGTIPEGQPEEPEAPAPPPQPQTRSAAMGRVTFEEGVVAGPPPPPQQPASPATTNSLEQPHKAEETRSPTQSGRWSEQASPELWPAHLVPQPVSAGADLDRPVSSSSTTITIPVANARQAKSAPARGSAPLEEALPGAEGGPAGQGEGTGVEDETPLPPPPSPEPLPSTQSLEPAERADSLRVHSGGATAMSPITESSEVGDREREDEEEEEEAEAEAGDGGVDHIPDVSATQESARTEPEEMQDT